MPATIHKAPFLSGYRGVVVTTTKQAAYLTEAVGLKNSDADKLDTPPTVGLSTLVAFGAEEAFADSLKMAAPA